MFPAHFFLQFFTRKKTIQSSPHSRNKNYGEVCDSRAVGLTLNYLFFVKGQTLPRQTSPVSDFADGEL